MDYEDILRHFFSPIFLTLFGCKKRLAVSQAEKAEALADSQFPVTSRLIQSGEAVTLC
jgi:hypothetical protein